MPKPKDTLDRLDINTPCNADWDEMIGNDQVRFCKHCDLSVYNVSEMTRQDAVRLVIGSKGKLCVRYIRNPDNAIHTTDLVLPKLHSIKRRVSRLAAGAFTAALSVSTSVVAAAPAPFAKTETKTAESTLVAKRFNSTSFGPTGATVTGIVKDPNGAVIAGATVTFTNESSNYQYVTTTDGEGLFRIQTSEEGSFTLTIAAEGFVNKVVSNISLASNVEQTIDESLNVEGTMMVMGGASIMSPSNPLVAAALEGDTNTLKDLLAAGTDVDVLDEAYDSTALGQAVSAGNREMVNILINAGADVNLKNHTGHTALMFVSRETTVEIIWALIDAGAKTELQDDEGKSVLHYLASSSNADSLRALLHAGASVDQRDKEDRTALMVAAGAGNTEGVAILLRAGATVNLRDEDGTTALGLALENDNTETAEILLAFGATE